MEKNKKNKTYRQNSINNIVDTNKHISSIVPSLYSADNLDN